MTAHNKIQQQYFTRDREGIFRTSEGFDTVAKSQGLDNAFIKSVLHPYCVYKAPQELLARDESNSELYPKTLLVFHADSGELVIGRNVYIGTDFTGQRSASFTHQFIIPKELQEPFLREPNRLFCIRGFRSSYDIRDGKSIPELEDIDFDPVYRQEEQDRLLAEQGIDSRLFQQLIYTIMSSATNKRKVYIVLASDVSESAEKAKRLLEIIYRCVPYAFRRQLGFMTFNSEPEAKQNIHIVFVEQGGLRLPDRRIEKDYVFDFANQRFVNSELPGQDHPLLDWIWKFRNDKGRLDELFDFCEQALQGAVEPVALAIPTYYQLGTLYEIEQGNDGLYEKNRAGTMNSLLMYLDKGTVRQKPRFKELFIRLLRKDVSDVEGLPTADYFKSLIAYYALAEEGEQALLIQCFMIFLNRVAARTGEGIEKAAPLFDLLLQQSSLFGLVMKELQKQSAATAEQYVIYRMKQVSSVDQLKKEVGFWLTESENVSLQRFFTNEVLKKSNQLLQRDTRKRIEAAVSLHGYFAELPSLYGKKRYEDFCNQLKLEIKLKLLEELNLAQLSYEDVIALGFVVDPLDEDLYRHADKSKKQLLILIGILYCVLMLRPGEENDAVEALRGLGPVELENVQESIKRLLADRIDLTRFSSIPLAFYKPQAEQGLYHSLAYNYEGLLEFIRGSSVETDRVHDFIIWSASDSRFLDLKGGINPHYKASISKYFQLRDTRAFKDKLVRQKLLAINNESFAVLFRTIKLKQSGKFVRFFVRNKRRLVRNGLIAAPFIIILLFVFWNPMMNWMASFGPPPIIVVEPLPEKSPTMNLALKATVKGTAKNGLNVKMYVNGQYISNGAVDTTVMLHDGENLFDITGVNRGGKSSEIIRQKVMYSMPIPTLTHGPIPETTKNSSITISVSAKDTNDPSPTIYINGQSVGQGSISQTINLVAGENPIEIKAGNNFGKMSDTIKKTVKYDPGSAAAKK
ncbi:cadherin-like beta sandwich domain-containing protein [Paenibacillus sp. N3.4]|uniref:GAP1-N2 domain-containing protein n=1 Tax=Paenibacillus sp. N3.4 TaxID=2603222 RepID=UPI0011C91C99|nr:cadherin-like beta sandwich domain-containing protein [Paenibacillus sp. N3.4]TXK83796.1 cadherin-like beta sandwich domain-containing protein [Paenibacillus sp. N3.4]